MKEISRTIPVSTVKAALVEFIDGKLQGKDLKDVVVFGEEIKKENAMKVVAKEYGKENTYSIKDVVVTQEVYVISLSDFLKAAKKVEPKQESGADQQGKQTEAK
jgi:hypothetical protein